MLLEVSFNRFELAYFRAVRKYDSLTNLHAAPDFDLIH